MASIRKILIANRGEIAIRIARTCREQGILSAAIYSDADRRSLHIAACDEAIAIGGRSSAESYLDHQKIIDAALRCQADAIHPGYGFVAENADFAQAVEDAGLVFIGTPPEIMRTLGDKRRAKAAAIEAGVPVVPGATENLENAGGDVGFPLLIKASAGGGGKGMHIVSSEAELAPALAKAKREALASFGDETLLIERYIETARHIEIQIVADGHGNIVHLGERECSIQRRHQKIIEEAPSPFVTDGLRQLMGDAAVALCESIGYSGLGTVEFVVSEKGDFYFLEVNTRLQVEHPVTEEITGIDLVAEQIRIAEGAELSQTVTEASKSFAPGASPKGAAIECRVYAEDPSNEFLPAAGLLSDWHLPTLPDIRVESGVEPNTEVSVYYDPMLAKLVSYGVDRATAIRKLRTALAKLSIHGIANNVEFLCEVLDHPEFVAGNTHTSFIEDYEHALTPEPPSDEERDVCAIAIVVSSVHERSKARTHLPNLLPGYRNNRASWESQTLRLGDDEIKVEYLVTQSGMRARIGDVEYSLTNIEYDWPRLRFCANHWHHEFRVGGNPQGEIANVHRTDRNLAFEPVSRLPTLGTSGDDGLFVAPMPGTIIEVLVAPGDTIETGQVIATLEAMKMEHSIRSPQEGVVESVHVSGGEQVAARQTLLTLAAK